MRSDQLPSIDAFVNRFNRLFKRKESSRAWPYIKNCLERVRFWTLAYYHGYLQRIDDPRLCAWTFKRSDVVPVLKCSLPNPSSRIYDLFRLPRSLRRSWRASHCLPFWIKSPIILMFTNLHLVGNRPPLLLLTFFMLSFSLLTMAMYSLVYSLLISAKVSI